MAGRLVVGFSDGTRGGLRVLLLATGTRIGLPRTCPRDSAQRRRCTDTFSREPPTVDVESGDTVAFPCLDRGGSPPGQKFEPRDEKLTKDMLSSASRCVAPSGQTPVRIDEVRVGRSVQLQVLRHTTDDRPRGERGETLVLH